MGDIVAIMRGDIEAREIRDLEEFDGSVRIYQMGVPLKDEERHALAVLRVELQQKLQPKKRK